jgi:hypothetical protein
MQRACSAVLSHIFRPIWQQTGSRLAGVAGFGNIADAAVIYVEKVIALALQICVLDWVTPALQACDPRLVQQVSQVRRQIEISSWMRWCWPRHFNGLGFVRK